MRPPTMPLSDAENARRERLLRILGGMPEGVNVAARYFDAKAEREAVEVERSADRRAAQGRGEQRTANPKLPHPN